MKASKWILFALACCSFAGCKPRPSATSEEIRNTPEGTPCGPDGMIADGEDNNNQIVVKDGRGGYWYTFADKEGSTITPPPGEEGGVFKMTQGGAEGSQYAANMKGKVGTASIVFTGMGFNFTDPKGEYDASEYGGLAFHAKRGPGSTPNVRLKVPDVNTDPDGGICSDCYNDFGKDFKFTEEWQMYVVPFDAMKQEPGWGAPKKLSINSEKLYAVQFQVNDKGKEYDIWVDNIQFTGCK